MWQVTAAPRAHRTGKTQRHHTTLVPLAACRGSPLRPCPVLTLALQGHLLSSCGSQGDWSARSGPTRGHLGSWRRQPGRSTSWHLSRLSTGPEDGEARTEGPLPAPVAMQWTHFTSASRPTRPPGLGSGFGPVPALSTWTNGAGSLSPLVLSPLVIAAGPLLDLSSAACPLPTPSASLLSPLCVPLPPVPWQGVGTCQPGSLLCSPHRSMLKWTCRKGQEGLAGALVAAAPLASGWPPPQYFQHRMGSACSDPISGALSTKASHPQVHACSRSHAVPAPHAALPVT